MPNLKDKKILITGASKGLGLVCAQAFSKQGAKLALIARSQDKLDAVKNGCANPANHICIAADLTDSAQLANAANTAKDFLKEVDVILHVAGGGLGLRSELIELKDLMKLFVLNVGAAAEINRFIVPAMQQRKKGNLVHVGSIASAEGVGSVGYNTAKAALAAYVRTLGRELAPSNVIATGILPGGFTAPENAMERLAQAKPEVYQEFIRERLPRKIMGDVSELIPMISLLCSEEASMMSGCMVPIDAGEGRSYVS